MVQTVDNIFRIFIPTAPVLLGVIYINTPSVFFTCHGYLSSAYSRFKIVLQF